MALYYALHSAKGGLWRRIFGDGPWFQVGSIQLLLPALWRGFDQACWQCWWGCSCWFRPCSACLPKAQAQDLAQDLSEVSDPGTTAAAYLDQALTARSDVMVVLDQSLSLYDPWDGAESRLQRVQRSLPDALVALPDSARTGVVTFGHRRAGDCADIQVLTNPVERPLDAQLMQDWQATPSPAAGERPLADAIETAAARIMRSSSDQGGAIVVLTDGLDSCGGDVCALATRLGQHQIPVHLVGLGLEQSEQMALSCLPARTGGALLLAAVAEEVHTHIDVALSRSHAANARRNAAQIARLVLQANARIDLLFSENQELISAAGVCTLNEGGEADHLAAAGGFPLSPPDPWLTGSAVRDSEARVLQDILGQSLSSLRVRRGQVNLEGLRLTPRVGVVPEVAPSLILASSTSTTDE